MDLLQVFISLRKGKWYLDEQGYGYRVNSPRPNHIYVLCVEKNCPARGKVLKMNNEAVGWVIRTNQDEHQHPPPDRGMIEFLKKLCRRAEAEPVSLKQLYDEESRHVSADLASDRTFVDVRRLMSGHRRRKLPPIPRTIPEMCNSIQQRRPEWGRIWEKTQGINRDFLVASRVDAAVFISPRTSELFEEEGITYTADGTFKVTPTVPNIYQLYTIGAVKKYDINGVEHKAFIPIVFAMLLHKTEEIYRWLIKTIKDLHPAWKPKAVMLDFEIAAMNAFRAEFHGHGPGKDPNFRVTGCWFHYSQSIQRKIQSLGLIVPMKEDDALRKTLKKFMALALLPPNFITEGFNHLKEELENGNFNAIPGIAQFQHYFDDYWMHQITPQRFSVFESVIRTNNNQEAFHGNVFLHCADGRRVTSPNVWRFIYALRMMEHAAAITHKAVQKNKRVTHRRKPKWIAQDIQILDAYLQLHNNPNNLNFRGRVTVFLNRAEHFFNFQLVEAGDEDDEIEVIEIDLEPDDPQIEIQAVLQAAQDALIEINPEEEVGADVEDDDDEFEVIEMDLEPDDALVEMGPEEEVGADVEVQVIELDDFF